jgi:predicted ester cyclase
MSTEHNKALVRRVFEEAMNHNKPDVYNEVIAADYVNYDFPTPTPGLEGFKSVDAMFKAAFPDFHVTIEDELAEGDRVASRGYFTGTHTGEFMGIPPTGKSIKVSYIDIWTVEGGKLKENWVQMDMLGLMQQLGVIPAPE